jgi:hypothetical protein
MAARTVQAGRAGPQAESALPLARRGVEVDRVAEGRPHIEPDAGDHPIEAMIFSFSTEMGCHAVLETSCRI